MIKKIFRILGCVFIVIIFPFVYPLVTKLLIHFKIYHNLEEFKDYMDIFLNPMFIILAVVSAVGVFIIAVKKNEIIDWLKRKDVYVNYKGVEAHTKDSDMVKESAKKAMFVDTLKDEDINNDGNIMTDIKNELKITVQEKNNKKTKTSKNKEIDEKKKLIEKNNNLRFYAAYNIINKKTKEILHIIYCEKSMRAKDFRNRIENSYKDKNKNNSNISKDDLKKYAKNKSTTILNGLIYLEIIEITDDDVETITLTQYGEEFVKKYIEKEVSDSGY